MWTVFDIVVFAAGFTACWLSKDKITQFATGTDAFVKTLEAKAAALKAAL
jgi:hypothetical protein